MRYLSILTFLFSIALNNSAHAGVLIKHIIRTILTITVACCSVSVCHAGVITVVGGYVTTAELDQDGDVNYTEDTNVKFTNASYNNIKSTPATDTMPWQIGTNGLATNLAIDLQGALNSTAGVDRTAVYTFTYGAAGTEVDAIVVLYGALFGWETRDLSDLHPDATTFESGDLYYASLDTATVPEPSTAIAMGLLGIVGFAGNRRRRRQS